MIQRRTRFAQALLVAGAISGIASSARAHDLAAIQFESQTNRKLLEARLLAQAADATANPSANPSAPRALPGPAGPSAAIRERLKIINTVIDQRAAIGILEAQKALVPFSVFDVMKTWDVGQVLKVCFVESDAVDAKRAIASYATEWQRAGANIRFDFGPPQSPRTCRADDGSLIRVTFRTDVYASYIGTDARAFAQLNQPTLFLRDFDTENYMTQDYKGKVLHEFGHALGLKHEHQHPAAECEQQFDMARVKQLYKWSDEDVKTNLAQLRVSRAYSAQPGIQIGTTLDGNTLGMTEYDKKSIMHYSLPVELFKPPPGSCYLGPTDNNELSDLDRKGIAFAYPKITRSAFNAQHNKSIERIMKDTRLSSLERSALMVLRR